MFLIIVLLLAIHFKNILVFIPRFITYGVLYLIVFTGYLIINCNERIDKVKFNKANFVVSFTMNDSINVKTDSVMLYIGQTRDYIFTYNKINKTTLIIPKNRIDNLEFSEMRNKP